MIKEIENHPNYFISDCGQIIRKEHFIIRSNGRKLPFKEKILVCGTHRDGYAQLKINRRPLFVHRLVAKAFISNPDNKPHVNHKDGDKKNNHVSNLEWVTISENNWHSYHILNNKTPAMSGLKGIKNGAAKIKTVEQINKIFELRMADNTTSKIAEIMGVSRDTIESILNKKRYSEDSENLKPKRKRVLTAEQREKFSRALAERNRARKKGN